MDKETTALTAAFRSVSRRFRRLQAAEDRGETRYLHEVAGAIGKLNGLLFRAEQAGWPAATIREQVAGIRDIHRESPFVRRLQDWPRGYPGDFETIELLWQQRNTAPPGSIGFWIEQYCLATAVAQQHRNKVIVQGLKVQQAILAGGKAAPARVLILAAGGCPDIRLIQESIAEREFSLVLCDADGDALDFSLQHLAAIEDRIALVRGDFLRKRAALAALGPFDLVVAGGLFDYLPDRLLARGIKVIHQFIDPGGCLFFTNMARGNPYRPWMEHVADWALIERDSDAVRSLLTGGWTTGEEPDLELDGTGLAILATLEPGPHRHPCTASGMPLLRSMRT